MPITPRPKTLRGRIVGVTVVFAFAVIMFVIGVPNKVNFDAEHKRQTQLIANELCAAASEKSCELSWGGKSKWFGTLEPSAAGLGKVGLDHIRKALPTPPWQESSESNGVVFTNEKYEVFYSSQSGAVAITRNSRAGPR